MTKDIEVRWLGPALDPADPLAPLVEQARNGVPSGDLMSLPFRVRNAAGAEGVARWMALIRQATGLGHLRYQVGSGDDPPAWLIPLSPDFRLSPEFTCAGGESVRLSRFAGLRREGETPLLESPLGLGVLYLRRAAVRFVASLFEGLAPAAMHSAAADLAPGQVDSLLCLLESMNALEKGAESSDLQRWEFHDLLFHARSRVGRAGPRHGGTHRFLGKSDPLPSLPRVDGPRVPLPVPDFEEMARRDLSLQEAIEKRHSTRRHDKEALTMAQLGEFLFRTSRVRAEEAHDASTRHGSYRFETARRPYPSGGAAYEMEVFAAVSRCGEISPGLYYYDPKAHALVRWDSPDPGVERLLADARSSTGSRDETFPQILLIYAARFGRVNWKYEGVAYSLVMKHVGVLQQTMCLVAESMGLAACALGAGNSDQFARATGLPYESWGSVGELAIGRSSAGRDAVAELK